MVLTNCYYWEEITWENILNNFSEKGQMIDFCNQCVKKKVEKKDWQE